jgi:cysteinyl-tRNA synthetase
MFVCGPTVYDLPHLGHGRTYVFFDFFARYLRYKKYELFYLQNITDIDDKIIKRAKELKKKPSEIASSFEKQYLEDMKNLQIKNVSKYARATEHIPEIISQIERLAKKGFVYQTKDGMYYDISKFKDYGKLSRRTALQAEDAVSRIDESKRKKNKGDFCLWKYTNGLGRPGWHIEDTAITEKYFGPQYDIHGGARDLIFPHHEAEIAQQESLSGKKPFVKYWMHTGFLMVKGKKMSKSLGNFITIRDLLKKYPAEIFRFMILQHHYRSPIDYDDKMMEQAERNLQRIQEFIEKLKRVNSHQSSVISIEKFRQKFFKYLDDDINTPKAIAVIFDLLKEGNRLIDRKAMNKKTAAQIIKLLKDIDKIFGLNLFKAKEKIPQEIIELAEKREKLRKEKKWSQADALREKIKKLGYEIKDRSSVL